MCATLSTSVSISKDPGSGNPQAASSPVFHIHSSLRKCTTTSRHTKTRLTGPSCESSSAFRLALLSSLMMTSSYHASMVCFRNVSSHSKFHPYSGMK